MNIRLSGVCRESSVDGQGLRYVVFTQGCKHNCKGCHNPETHDFNGGYIESVDNIIEDIKRNKILRGITVSGGDPMEQPEALYELVTKTKAIGKTVWVYTGYTYDELVQLKNEYILKILNTIDVLVDGKYIEKLKNINLRYKGSSNQRVIDCKRTRETGEIKIYYC